MTDQSLFGHNDHVLFDAVFCTAIDDDDARPCRRLASDDTCAHKVELMGCLLIIEECAQAFVFRLIFICRDCLNAESLDFFSKHFILFMHCRDIRDRLSCKLHFVAHPRGYELERHDDG